MVEQLPRTIALKLETQRTEKGMTPPLGKEHVLISLPSYDLCHSSYRVALCRAQSTWERRPGKDYRRYPPLLRTPFGKIIYHICIYSYMYICMHAHTLTDMEIDVPFLNQVCACEAVHVSVCACVSMVVSI